MTQGVATDERTSIGTVASRGRACRHAPPMVVKFMPAVQFAMPIVFDFSTAHHAPLEPVLAGEVD